MYSKLLNTVLKGETIEWLYWTRDIGVYSWRYTGDTKNVWSIAQKLIARMMMMLQRQAHQISLMRHENSRWKMLGHGHLLMVKRT